MLVLDTAATFCWGPSDPDGRLAALFDLRGGLRLGCVCGLGVLGVAAAAAVAVLCFACHCCSRLPLARCLQASQ